MSPRTGFVVAVLGAALFASTALAFTNGSKEQTLAGKNIVQWHKQAVKMRVQRDHYQTGLGNAVREIRRLNRVRPQVHSPSSLEAIRLAAITYGQSYGDMVRVASCETGGDFNPYAKNPSSSASGLFQYLTGTWASTPYGRESVWSPYASALATGWMWSHGRKGEWVCR